MGPTPSSLIQHLNNKKLFKSSTSFSPNITIFKVLPDKFKTVKGGMARSFWMTTFYMAAFIMAHFLFAFLTTVTPSICYT